ncbi:hypothetical protein [Vibrio breoganii]|uniref:Porin n=1 Tax=Vibrio breoganii TaxID=553239 RepID=A0ABX1U5M7_9VIBR|nr:hypothetical protein [Vibrio breoganii]NMO74776.1 hypothetical protein [Vibrio breoganii]NMR68705.1 hypothetical protein [Vibrio breoganii]PML83381.1 hypothetical protein BCT67_17455 [Vibrio breoganii]
MKFNKTTLLLASFIVSPAVIASSNVDFSNTNEHYTGFSLEYGSDDFGLGVQYSTPINKELSFLSAYSTSKNFDAHDFKIGLETSNGLGVTFEYEYDADFRSDGLRSNDYELSLYKTSPINSHLTLTPELSVGNFEQQQMSSSVYYTTASLDITYEINNNIWLGVTPEYTYSLGKVKEKNGNQSKIREWDYTASVGYQISGVGAFIYSYQYDDGDNLSLFSYKHAF